MKHYYSEPMLNVIKIGEDDIVRTSLKQDETKGSTFQEDVFTDGWI